MYIAITKPNVFLEMDFIGLNFLTLTISHIFSKLKLF